MVQSVLALPDHLAVFERGIANHLDFSYAGPQSRKLAELVAANAVRIGAIHTISNSTPHAGGPDAAGRTCRRRQGRPRGHLYTGPNTEDTPTIAEATASGRHRVAQVTKIVNRLPRVDVPGDWIDVVVRADAVLYRSAVHARSRQDRNENVLMAMMAIAAVYEPTRWAVNHGIGYATAANRTDPANLRRQARTEGEDRQAFVLNPHPTADPGDRAGFVRQRLLLRLELGIGTLRPRNRRYIPGWRRRQSAVQPALGGRGTIRLRSFIGGTLQIDAQGNSSTATKDRIHRLRWRAEYGRRPRGRTPRRPTWLRAGRKARREPAGTQLVVQMRCRPISRMAHRALSNGWTRSTSQPRPRFALPPVIIYGDDVTHVFTERA